MKLIPGIALDNGSTAEQKVFERIRSMAVGDEWTAYHSLNCREHAYKSWAEIDFLLVGPQAILTLEVKGGRISCKDGVWSIVDRGGLERRTREGPFNQARSATFALRRLLVERYEISQAEIDNVPLGWGVVFPDVDWDVDTVEMPLDIVADRMAMTSQGAWESFFEDLRKYWTAKTLRPAKLSSASLARIREKLRPDLDLVPPMSLCISRVASTMQRLTDEQYERLDVLEANPRGIVVGGAGTGKTYLMMQFAARASASGSKVLVIVKSPTLAAHLRLMRSASSIAVLAMEEAVHLVMAPHDMLLVDEGQDLLAMPILRIMEPWLRGGWAQGRWYWFMDDRNQCIDVGAYSPDAHSYLRGVVQPDGVLQLPLRRNCRNTKEIARCVRLWTGADIGVADVSGAGLDPIVECVESSDQAAACLSRYLTRWLDVEEVCAGDIGIVTLSALRPSAFNALPMRLQRLLVPLSPASVAADLKDYVVWGSVDVFKGLERPFIVIVADELVELSGIASALYVGLTRANVALLVVASVRLAAYLKESELACDSQPCEGGR